MEQKKKDSGAQLQEPPEEDRATPMDPEINLRDRSNHKLAGPSDETDEPDAS